MAQPRPVDYPRGHYVLPLFAQPEPIPFDAADDVKCSAEHGETLPANAASVQTATVGGCHTEKNTAPNGVGA